MKDTRTLELIGQGLAKGLPPPKRALAHARKLYSEEELIVLAESDETSEDAMRAIQLLLESE